MDTVDLFYRFGVALIIGVLVGLEREYAFERQEWELFAGVRTFALLSLAGCGAAFASDYLNSIWAFVVVMGMFASLVAVAYFIGASRGEIGMTSEVAAGLTLLLGAIAYWEFFALAAALAVIVTVLLSLKRQVQTFTREITREDVYATLKFAVITAIILPVLPDTAVAPAPFDVVTPYKLWLMVVFISGISFLGYVLIKIVGPEQGIGLTGLLGGLASSTAVTLSLTQRSRDRPDLSGSFSLGIMAAWTVMFSRVFIEIGVLSYELLGEIVLPLGASMIVGLVYAGFLFFNHRTTEKGNVSFSNPFELRPALQFGLIYGVVLIISNVALEYYGGTGVYISSFLAGLADVDAIALSMADLTRNGELGLEIGGQAVVLAAMANTLAKGGIALLGGSRAFRRTLLPGLLLMLITGFTTAFLF